MAIKQTAGKAFDNAIKSTYSSRPIQRVKEARKEEKKYSGKLVILK